MKSPIRADVTKVRLNRTLHGRSVYRKKDVPGHNVFWGYNHPGTGDGLDLFVPGGEPVFAMHSGVARQIQEYGRNGKLAILGSDEASLYAHIHVKEGLKDGSFVREGQVIGYVGKLLKDPHLHLEVKIGGKAVSGIRPKSFAYKLKELISEG